jgi:hypothetical protein
MSVQFTQNPQQVVMIENGDEDRQVMTCETERAPLDRMTSRSGDEKNPYAFVQEQLTQEQLDNYSREERADRLKMRRIFDRVSNLN